MTRDELTDRIHELFPPLAEVEDRQWTETTAGASFVLIEEIGFTGLDSGAIELVGTIPETGLVAVYRIEPDNTYKLVWLTDDPAIGMQAALN